MSERLSLGDLADRTPDTRDRYVDFVRAFSIITVVVGHWMICIVWWRNGYIRSSSALGEVSGLWLATWIFQVMPLFFFVGGFSNLVTYDSYRKRGLSTGAFLKSRAMRLLKPSFVFLGVWLVVQVALHLLDIGAGTGFKIWGDTWFLRGMVPPGATIPFGPLWFLPAYLVVIALAPPMLRLHRRFGIWVVVALTVLTIVVDVVGFGGNNHGFRYWNIFFVWLLPHQIGFFYGDGRMQRLSTRFLAVMALCGLAVMILLTNPWIFGGHGPDLFNGLPNYPKSLLGTDNEPVANTYPPTFVMVGMIYWSIGVCMLLRRAGQRWLQRSRRAWMGTIWVNSVIMTLYLWHMTAFLLAILLLWPLSLGQQTVDEPVFMRYHPDASWWIQRPLFVLVPGVILFGIVLLFGRYERPIPSGEGRGDVRARNLRFLAKLAVIGLVVFGLSLLAVRPWVPPGRLLGDNIDLYRSVTSRGNCVDEATLEEEGAWPLEQVGVIPPHGRIYVGGDFRWALRVEPSGEGIPLYGARTDPYPNRNGGEVWTWMAVPKGDCYWLYHING